MSMTKKTAVWLGSIVALSLLGATLLQAQKKEGDEGYRVVVTPADGQGWLGVHLEDVTADKARSLKLPGEYGAIVTGVKEDSPAAKAGLKENDAILEFGGERVRSAAMLKRMIKETPPGRTVTLKVSHDGQTRAASVTLEARHLAFGGPRFEGPGMFEMPEIPEIKIPNFYFGLGGSRLGVSADELTPQLAEYFGVKGGKGVLVREVNPGSAAEKAGLKAGDCIVRVGSKKISSVGDLQSALGDQAFDSGEAKRVVELTIVRNRQEQTVKVELEHYRRWPLPAEAKKLSREVEELQRLSAKVRALTPEVVDQSLLYWGDDDEDP